MTGKIFGIGLNKTGTKTLAACFEILGKRHLSLRADLLAKYRSGDIEGIWTELENFDTFEDWPYPLMYKELFFRYGRNARFILTKRVDALTWLGSLMRHSLRTDPEHHCRILVYGHAYPHGLEAYHMQFYERHILEVTQFFHEQRADHQLLHICWETGDGWEKLCSFLELPVPEQEIPHRNKSAAFPYDPELEQRNIEKMRAQQARLNFGAHRG